MKNAEQANASESKEVARNILTRHLNSFLENDLELLMCDYTDRSVLITQEKTYIGLKEIELFFSGLMPHFPKGRSGFCLDKLVIHDELAYIVWNAKTPTIDDSFGTDTFIFRSGKIYRQTFAGKMNFVL